MLRTLAGVLVGYITLAIAVIAGMLGLAAAIGRDNTLEPGRYAPSTSFCVLSLAVSFAAALLGGWVARKLGGTRTAVLILALLVAVLGGGMAAKNLSQPRAEPEPRAENEADSAKLMAMREPEWLVLTNPVLGAFGLLLGGRALRRDAMQRH
jgi:hypothetical protein